MVGCFVLIISLFGYFVLYRYHYKIIWDHGKKIKEKIEIVEKSYANKPNLGDAYYLLDVYIGIENYDKALYYGKACLEHGADDEMFDGKINFFLARSYYEKNQKELARRHLLAAIKLSKIDDEKKIEQIKTYGLSDIAPEGFAR